MSEKKIGGINAPLIVVGIILMIIGLLMLSLAFNEMLSLIYWGSVLGSGGLFSSANGMTEFTLFAFIIFVVGLIITEKQIIENQTI